MSVCWREETEKEKKTKLPYFFPTSLTLTDRVFVRVLVCVSEWVSVCLFVLSFVPLLWSKKLRHTDTWTRELATPATAAAAATTAIGSTLLSLFFTFSLLLLLLFFSSHFQCNLQVPAVTNNLSERKRKTVTKKKEKNCSGGKKRQPRRLRHSRGHVLTHGEILSICVLLLLSAVVVVSCCFCCCFCASNSARPAWLAVWRQMPPTPPSEATTTLLTLLLSRFGSVRFSLCWQITLPVPGKQQTAPLYATLNTHTHSSFSPFSKRQTAKEKRKEEQTNSSTV